LRIQIPKKILNVLATKKRYKALYGGRGSAKTYSVSLMLAALGMSKKLKILCCREFQNSIKDSSLSEIKEVISKHKELSNHYQITENTIRGVNGTEFIFKGLARNIESVKSLSQVDICWIEEAETISQKSIDVLLPTIRKKDSEIWATWNPEKEDSPINKFFIENTPNNCAISKINYYDNPFFPDILEEERKNCFNRESLDIYNHIWEGDFLTKSDALVFNNFFKYEDFEIDDSFEGAYFGLDFGFAQDPTACVEVYIKDNTLYIYREAGKIGLELDDTYNFIKKNIPNINDRFCWADNSRPESISYLKRHGMDKLKPCNKWAGSIEDGISYIKSFNSVIIHTRCKEVYNEFRKYSYKVDRRTCEVLNKIEDSFNHYIDALRYSLNDMIKAKGKFFLG